MDRLRLPDYRVSSTSTIGDNKFPATSTGSLLPSPSFVTHRSMGRMRTRVKNRILICRWDKNITERKLDLLTNKVSKSKENRINNFRNAVFHQPNYTVSHRRREQSSLTMILTDLEARKNQLDPNLVVMVAVVVIMLMKPVFRTRNLRISIRDFNAHHTSRND